MSNSTIAMVFAITLNVIMAMSQLAITDLNPTGHPFSYNSSGTILEHYDKGKVLDTSDESIKEGFPSAALITPSSGNPFTDLLSSITAWLSDTLGLKYIKVIMVGPYNIIKPLNLPESLTYLFGTLWWLITGFIMISWIFGRN